MNNPGVLSEKYTIDTPENVTFGYDVAGIGSRFIGALIDTTLIVVLLVVLNLLLAFALAAVADGAPEPAFDTVEDPGWVTGLLIAIYGLLTFAVIWGYYLAFELGWNGQTPGKRAAGTQVVKTDGSPAAFLEVAIRNLVRIIDFLPAAYAIGVVTMFCNRQSRRLGDYAAGTLVIKHRRAVRLQDLAGRPPVAPPVTPPTAAAPPRFAHLRRLTAADLQIIRDVLARHDRGTAGPDLLRRLAAAIAAKLEEPPPEADWVSCRRFLGEVMDAARGIGG